MSIQQEIDSIISEVADPALENDKATVDRALLEVRKLLSATQDSMRAIYSDIEAASNRSQLKKAFRWLNGIWGIFLGLQLAPESSALLVEAISALDVSDRMAGFLGSSSSIGEALNAYTSAIISDLAVVIRRSNEQLRAADDRVEALFSELLPDPCSPISEPEKALEEPAALTVEAEPTTFPIKRHVASIGPLTVIPKKKSRIPALANVAAITESGVGEGTSKKKVLMTREKLRAAQHDKRGLLNLVDTSTNALERTKKLELLKAAGYGFTSQGKNSFADRLNAARVRLDLGMGAHSSADTLLFGAQVLSAQGALSRKNIDEVENKVVDSNTT